MLQAPLRTLAGHDIFRYRAILACPTTRLSRLSRLSRVASRVAPARWRHSSAKATCGSGSSEGWVHCARKQLMHCLPEVTERGVLRRGQEARARSWQNEASEVKIETKNSGDSPSFKNISTPNWIENVKSCKVFFEIYWTNQFFWGTTMGPLFQHELSPSLQPTPGTRRAPKRVASRRASDVAFVGTTKLLMGVASVVCKTDQVTDQVSCPTSRQAHKKHLKTVDRSFLSLSLSAR